MMTYTFTAQQGGFLVKKARKKSAAYAYTDKHAPRVASRVKKVLDKWRKKVTSQLIAKLGLKKAEDDKDIDDILRELGLEGMAAEVSDATKEDILEAFKNGGVEAVREVAELSDSREDMFSVVNEDAVEYAEDRAAQMVGKIVNEDGKIVDNPNSEWSIDEATREGLRGSVSQAIEEGWTSDQLSQDIETNWGFSESRSDMIARTELADAETQGSIAGWKASGVVSQKQWVASQDCCDDCDEVDGEVVDLDEDFSTGDDGPPMHPNCRCALVAITDEEGDVERIDLRGLLRKGDVEGHEFHGNQYTGGEAGSNSEKQEAPTVKRGKDFATEGEYNVTFGSDTYQMYRDPEHGSWYQANTGTHFTDSWLGHSKKEAVERLTLLHYSGRAKGKTKKTDLSLLLTKGGSGSGNFGHEGRPGEVGGAGEGAGMQTGLTLSKSTARAFTGAQKNTKTQLSKLETGALGEKIAVQWLQQQKGFADARSLNTHGNNFAVDLIGDHSVTEVKAGLVSNGDTAQHWRATIGQPGKEEQAWLKKASPEAKHKWNEQKAKAIMDRKQAAVKAVSKSVGFKVAGQTVTVIIDPDRKIADVYRFDGFHSGIRWNSEQAKNGYVGSFKYSAKK